MIVVSNAGPLIALARIGRLELLQKLFGQVSIPAAVRREVVEHGAGLPGAKEAKAAAWLHLATVSGQTEGEFLHSSLGAGESEAVLLAIELGADLLLMDEAKGRRVAEARGLSVIGTLGFLVVAKRRGLVSTVTPLVAALASAGFRMSAQLRDGILAKAGEGG